jgi:hypothetical protein
MFLEKEVFRENAKTSAIQKSTVISYRRIRLFVECFDAADFIIFRGLVCECLKFGPKITSVMNITKPRC